ncbi:uncharacterized protein LOC120250619 [Dioscorea cayenensis subsp. rotundata]|uniref:Uncharacterized protein LOC120250619 n=1 Tax=Dioscorea cayennensis subsp. rotundata TaxID=55577 RepID=A0AB40AKM3_DIOCR|nr:uncharacterized protein LOC120250619 [Dioscorea cayenensis subsp. rotundata]
MPFSNLSGLIFLSLQSKLSHMPVLILVLSRILLAGCLPLNVESQAEADILTLAAALNVVTSLPFQISNIFVSNTMISKLIHSVDPVCSWRLSSCVDRLKILLSQVNWPRVNSISRQSLRVISKLAGLGHNLHQLCLFHSGRELPQWLMKYFLEFGFIFA